jgi:hypothetical protein
MRKILTWSIVLALVVLPLIAAAWFGYQSMTTGVWYWTTLAGGVLFAQGAVMVWLSRRLATDDNKIVVRPSLDER